MRKSNSRWNVVLALAVRLERMAFLALLVSWFVMMAGNYAAAIDPLGSATGGAVSCSSVNATAGVPGGTCYLLQVNCPGIENISMALKLNAPSGTAIGTVMFAVGGGNTEWYDQHFTYGSNAIEMVESAGYNTVQTNYMFKPTGFGKGQTFAGWLTGPGGARALACRWATVAVWVHSNIAKANTPFCATGNSAASAAAGYALADYGLGSMFNMLEETSGPPLTHIDRGCLCNTPKENTTCGQGVIAECYGMDARMFIDPSYNNTKCSAAEKIHRSSYDGQFLHDSLDSTDATLSYPTTDIHFVFGGLDTSGAVPQGLDWKNAITAKTTPVVDCVADAPHEIGDVLDGATKIATDLITYCH
jgi:hypothetical protein